MTPTARRIATVLLPTALLAVASIVYWTVDMTAGERLVFITCTLVGLIATGVVDERRKDKGGE